MILSLVMLLTFAPISLSATVVGEDVTQNLPINSQLETVAEIANINTQISGNGTASLVQDRASGKYAVNIVADDIINQAYIEYDLAATELFDIAENSGVSLWVKPGAGAKWIKFYTNDALILGDSNQDGIYNVGQDLVSGKWNQVKLDLTETQPAITQGDDFTVQTNDASVWLFDEVVSETTTIFSVDLSKTINSKTQLVNNEIQFKKKTTDTYDIAPTVLVSQKGDPFDTVFTSETDWNEMTRSNVDTSISQGNVLLDRSGTNLLDTDTVNADFSGSGVNTVPLNNSIVLSYQENANLTTSPTTQDTLVSPSSGYDTATYTTTNELQGVVQSKDTWYKLVFNVTPSNTKPFSSVVVGGVQNVNEWAVRLYPSGNSRSTPEVTQNGSTFTYTYVFKISAANSEYVQGYVKFIAESYDQVSSNITNVYMYPLSFEESTYKYYFQNFAAGYDPATERGAWDKTSGYAAKKLGDIKYGTQTSTANAETSSTSDYDVLVVKAVSNPLPQDTLFTGKVHYCLKQQESSTYANMGLHSHIFVTAGDTDVVRGTLLSGAISPTEMSTTASGLEEWYDISTVNAQAGDRIVFEAGYRAVNTSTTSYSGSIFYGGTSSDLLHSSVSTTASPWVAFTNESEIGGTYTHPEQDISGMGACSGSSIVFNKTTPTNTTATVEVRVYDGAQWSDWQAKNSEESILPTNTDLTGYKVQWRAKLTTLDGAITPSVDDVTVTVDSPYQASGTITSEPINNPGNGGIKLTYNATILQNTTLNLEWRDSSDGSTWGNWSLANNGETYGNKEYFQFRANLGTYNTAITPILHDVTATMVGGDYVNAPPLPVGKISKISINSGYTTSTSEAVSVLPTGQIYLTDELPTKIAFSGDGSTLFFKNPDDSDQLYMMKLNNGEKIEVMDTVPTDFKSDYDGNRVAYRNGTTLYITGVTGTVSTGVTLYAINDDGNVAYYKTNSLNLYTTTNQSIYSGTVTCLDMARASEDIFFSNTTNLYKVFNTPAGWKNTKLYTAWTDITGLWANSDGSLIFLQMEGGSFYVYEAYSKALRKINLTAATIVKITDDNKVIAQDANYNYICYNPETDQTIDIRPDDAKNPPSASDIYFDVDNAGSQIAYVASPTTTGDAVGVGINNLQATTSTTTGELSDIPAGAERPERYLFSFDNKNSWSSYKDGMWVTVKAGSIPDNNDFAQYGMTIDEVNSLTEKDFGYLYENGRQIFNFDVAIYFASVNPYITPSLKGITVTLCQSGNGFGNELTEKALYAAKEQIFDGSNWRKVRKIYPIELSPKEAEIYYFILADNVYNSFKDEWKTVNSSLLSDVEANWVDITLQGMSAQELRAIPEAELTSLLAGESFNIVYCLKVLDESTVKYSSNINIDYVEDLFTSSTLTLNIIYNDGTVKEYTSLTDTDVEDFMQWLSERQFNRGPIYYRIKVASNNDFINYYMIQSVNVVE